jgi:AcrR family transcriptional regulator
VDRRTQLLQTAAELFAKHGYHGVSINDLGAACGISGPALYKHFRGKQAILAEMLLSISEELLVEGRRRARAADDDERALGSLAQWHVDFALDHAPVIVVQDRDWSALPVESREKVRETQRKYVEVWVKVVRGVHANARTAGAGSATHDPLSPRSARAMVHAAFGLINSTPHSALLPREDMHRVLTRMAFAALSAPLSAPVSAPV